MQRVINMANRVAINLLKLHDAGSFWGCEKPGPYSSGDTQQFQELYNAINQHFTAEMHVIGRVTDPKQGKMYIGQHNKKKDWNRVVVKEVLASAKGTLTVCLFVDTGETDNVLVHCLREAPEVFTKMRHQARFFVLGGIQPITMTSDPCTMVTVLQPTDKWDPAAKTFMDKVLNGHQGLEAEIMSSIHKRVSIRLYIKTQDGREMCANDLLVEEKFARNTSDSPTLISPSSTPTPNDYVNTRNSPSLFGATNGNSVSPSPPRQNKGRGSILQQYLNDTSPKRSSPTSPTNNSDDVMQTPSMTNMGRNRCAPINSPNGIEARPFMSSQNTNQSDRYSSGEESSARRRRICFSDTEQVFTPSKGGYLSDPSPDARPNKSILKKSPSSSESQREMPKIALRDESGKATNVYTVTASDDIISEREERRKFVPSSQLDGSGLLDVISGGVAQLQMAEMENISPEEEGVFYWSHDIVPKARRSFRHVPFGELMAEMVGAGPKQSAGPFKLQAFAWKPMMKGRDLVAIAAKTKGGKTLCYVAPLIYQLQNMPGDYNKLPRGNGPKVLILCSSWRPAMLVTEMCSKAATRAYRSSKNHRNAQRVLLIYGAEQDGSHEINLLNGCDVLVATPHCLLRMIEKGSLSLRRVCHLVLDDADVLCERFTLQVDLILRRFKEHKAEYAARSINQVLAFAATWTPALGVFAREHMEKPAPTVVMASLTEAAIFGHVKMAPQVCDNHNRVTKLIELCDGALNHGGKTLVLTGNVESAINAYEHLRAASSYVLVAHEQMSMDELYNVNKRWHDAFDPKSPPLLVATDEVLTNGLSITDAKAVIHFDPPMFLGTGKGKQWQMGRRLWCMKDWFANPVANEEIKPQCVSHLLITPNIGHVAKAIRTLLRRTCNHIPPLLNKVADIVIEKAERDGGLKPLCHNIKAFGRCRNEKQCRGRHLVFETDTTPETSHAQKLPTDGIVKVWITAVQTANFFYGRLLEHQASSGEVTSLRAGNTKLFMGLNKALGSPEERKKLLDCDVPVLNTLYAYEDTQHSFHRVKTVELSEKGPRGFSERVRLFFVDSGDYKEIAADDLFLLPDQFKDVPYEAVELYVCRVKPLDEDIEWTERAVGTMRDMFCKMELYGNIVLSLGNSLWLDPLVERMSLGALKAVENRYNVRTELRSLGFGAPNNTHLQDLEELCMGRITLPDLASTGGAGAKAYTACGMPIIPKVCQLRMRREEDHQWAESDDWQLVYVSAVASPNLIFLQLASKTKERLEIMDEIGLFLRYNIDEDTHVSKLKPGSLVIAKSPFDEYEWQRGKVMNVETDGKIDVLFVDTGEQEFVEESDIRPMRSRFMTHPFQAIECNLMHVEPNTPDGEWSEEISDFIWDLTRETDEAPKALYAKVIATSPARINGRLQYGVELFVGSSHSEVTDKSRECGTDLSELLVAKEMAVLTVERITELFPGDLTRGVVEDYKYIPVQCAVLLQQPQNREKFANEILTSVKSALKQQDKGEGLVRRGLVTCLVHVLGHVWQLEVVDPITKSLFLLFRFALQHMDEACVKLCVNQLCVMLDMSPDPMLHVYVQKAMRDIARSGQLGHSSILGRGGVRILCKLVQSSHEPESKVTALETLAVILNDLNSSDVSAVSQTALIPVLCGCLEYTEPVKVHYDKSLRGCTLVCLEKIAAHTTLKDAIRKHNGIKALQTLLEDSNQQVEVHEACLRCLKMVSSNNRFNKEHMQELKLPETLKKVLLASRLSEDSLSQCQELYERLLALRPSGVPTVRIEGILTATNKIKKQPMMNKPLPKKQIDEYSQPLSRASPDVKWTQNKWNVLLSVDVRDVNKNSNVVTLTNSELKFRAVAHSIEYIFNFTLFELIDEMECQVKIRNSQVLVGLRKKSKGLWPRLLKQKSKPSFLKVDHDRYLDSSSESENSDEENKNPIIPKPLELAKRNVHRRTPFSMTAEGDGKPITNGRPDGESSEEDSSSSDPEDHDDLQLDRECMYFS